MADLAQSAVDQCNLFRCHKSIALRPGDVAADRRQGFAELGMSFGEVFGGAYPPGRIPGRDAHTGHEHPDHGSFRQAGTGECRSEGRALLPYRPGGVRTALPVDRGPLPLYVGLLPLGAGVLVAAAVGWVAARLYGLARPPRDLPW